MNVFDVIQTIRVSEKAMDQSSNLNQYTLVADKRANKIQIRNAVEELFKVTVLRVNTVNVSGKKRRQRTLHRGKSRDWKKAIVTLKKGDRISFT